MEEVGQVARKIIIFIVYILKNCNGQLLKRKKEIMSQNLEMNILPAYITVAWLFSADLKEELEKIQ